MVTTLVVTNPDVSSPSSSWMRMTQSRSLTSVTVTMSTRRCTCPCNPQQAPCVTTQLLLADTKTPVSHSADQWVLQTQNTRILTPHHCAALMCERTACRRSGWLLLWSNFLSDCRGRGESNRYRVFTHDVVFLKKNTYFRGQEIPNQAMWSRAQDE